MIRKDTELEINLNISGISVFPADNKILNQIFFSTNVKINLMSPMFKDLNLRYLLIYTIFFFKFFFSLNIYFFYTGVKTTTGQRVKIVLVVVSTVLFAVFVAFWALLGTYLSSLMEGNIICQMASLACNLSFIWNVI